MPGTNAGTGQPISFQCAKCRLAKSRHRYDSHEWHHYSRQGGFTEVELTGKSRSLLNCGARSSDKSRQYKCLSCGHVGWSRHTDLQRKEEHALKKATR